MHGNRLVDIKIAGGQTLYGQFGQGIKSPVVQRHCRGSAGQNHGPLWYRYPRTVVSYDWCHIEDGLLTGFYYPSTHFGPYRAQPLIQITHSLAILRKAVF